MEILQLRYFFESAQHESFAKTAEKYMVPSSSVSASVRQLEKELDCKLFDRTSNRIILNNNGKKLKQTLNIVFSNLDKVAHELTTKERNIAIDYWQNKMSIGDISEKYCISRSSFYRTIDVIKKKLETSLKYVLFYNEILKPPTKEDFLSQIMKASSMEASIEN